MRLKVPPMRSFRLRLSRAGLNSRRSLIIGLNLGFIALLFVTATVIWHRSVSADSNMLIPPDSVVYQGQVSGFSFSQTASAYTVGGQLTGNIYLMSSNTQVLGGSTATLNIPTLNQTYTLKEVAAGQYQFQLNDQVVVSPQITGQDTNSLANWSLGLRNFSFNVGNAPQSSVAQSNVVLKVSDITSKWSAAVTNLSVFPVSTGFISNANIAAIPTSVTGSTYTLNLSGAVSAQVLDSLGNPVANQALTVQLSFPTDNHTETVTVNTDSNGIFTYHRTETATLTVKGGQIATLNSPLTVQGTSSVQDICWSGCGGGSGPSGQQVASTQGPAAPNAQTAADPINAISGNMYDVESDLSYPSVGIPGAFQRTYNSTMVELGQSSAGRTDTLGIDNLHANGPFGWGWAYSYGMAVSVNQDGTVSYADGNGSGLTYTPSNGGYAPPPGVHDKLTHNADGSWTMRLKHGQVQQFDPSGKLLSITDPSGNAMAFTYAGSQLQTIADTAGRKLALTWDGNGHIVAMTDPLGRKFSYTYDSASNLVKVVFPDASTIGYAYDGFHELTQITDPKSNHRTFTYDGSGHALSFQYDGGLNKITYSYDVGNGKTTTTDSRGNQTVYYHTYIGNTGVITKVVDPLGNAQSFQYDNDANRTSATDRTGNTTTKTYDGMGNALTTTDPLGAVTTYTYDATYSNPTSVKNALGATTTLAYDAHGNLISATDAQGNVTQVARDARGETTSITDGRASVTQIAYDASGNATSVIDATGNHLNMTYDGLGHATSMTDALGHKTQLSYDAFYRTTGITRADGSKMAMSYDAVGNVAGVTDANGNVTTLTYDTANMIAQMGDAANNVTKVGRDSEENVTSLSDQLGNVTQITYDVNNRPVKVVRPNGSVQKFAYDGNGNRTSVTDERGNTTAYKYDGNNRLVGVGLPGFTTVVQYQYDPLGELLKVIDLRGDSRTYSYDTLRRLAQFTDANGHSWKYGYDANGNLTTRTDAKGQTTANTYDAINRLVKASFADGVVDTYAYDTGGNLTQVTDGHGTTGYSYDTLNRLIQTTEPSGWVEKYGYDANGNRTSLTDSTGNQTAFAYNNLNEMTKVTAPNGQTASYTYDAKHQLVGQQNSDGSATSWQWDVLGRLLQTLNTVSGVTSSSFTYVYDAAGNRTSVAGPKGTTSYAYDALNRLTGVTNPDASTASYTYDAVGNRTSSTVSGATTTATFDPADQMTQNGTTNYTYDANGNLSSAVSPAGTTNYTWDAQDRLTGVQTPTATVQEGYDAFGRMVSRTDGHGNTAYFYDGGNVLLAHPTHGSTYLASEYLPGANGQIAGIDRLNGSGVPLQSESFYQRDGQGSVVGLTSQGGNGPTVPTASSWDAWGNPSGLTDSDDTYGLPLGYLGLPYDQEAAGLTWAHARWYDASQGRMLSRDPLGGGLAAPSSQNRYAYALDNPTTYMDPSGMSTILAQDLNNVGQQMTTAGGAIAGAILTYIGQGLLSAPGGWVYAGALAAVAAAILFALTLAGVILSALSSVVAQLSLFWAIVLLSLVILIAFVLIALLIWALVAAALAAATLAAFFSPVVLVGLGLAFALFFVMLGIGLAVNQWAAGQPT